MNNKRVAVSRSAKIFLYTVCIAIASVISFHMIERFRLSGNDAVLFVVGPIAIVESVAIAIGVWSARRGHALLGAPLIALAPLALPVVLGALMSLSGTFP